MSDLGIPKTIERFGRTYAWCNDCGKYRLASNFYRSVQQVGDRATYCKPHIKARNNAYRRRIRATNLATRG
jgi:hypothetical protein